MATNIRDVKIRIQATKKTSQITNAMNMISQAKLKTQEKAIRGYQPYLEKIKEVVLNIMSNISDSKDVHNILLNANKDKNKEKICYFLITSDKGLSGAFNNNAFKFLKEEIKKDHEDFVIAPIGLKGYYFSKKNKYPIYRDKYISIRDDIEFNEVIPFIKSIIKGYILGDFTEVKVIYNHYINVITQDVRCVKVLPISYDEITEGMDKIKHIYEFDGNIEDMLNMILPIYIENVLYGYMLNSKASEHAARQNAMKNATDNALEIVKKLELLYNRARQQAITLELTDIIGGASVINDK